MRFSSIARVALASGLAAVAISVASPAFAQSVATSYTADGCQGINSTDAANTHGISGFGMSTGTMQSTTRIVCPIVKTTSGPSVTSNDGISVSVSFAPATTATCYLNIYSADPHLAYNAPNVIDQQQASTSPTNLTLTLTSAVTGYWQGATGLDNWYYPELHCAVNSSGFFYGYTVTEAGTAQSDTRITSAAQCRSTASTAYTYSFYAAEPPSLVGGYVESIAGGFVMQCPALPGGGKAVEFALGPSLVSSKRMGCQSISLTLPNQGQYGAYASYAPYQGTEFPPVTAYLNSFYPSPTPALPIQCFEEAYWPSGDGKLLSYRTGPDPTVFQ